MEIGITDIAVARMWAEIPAEERQDMLANAWCPNCGDTSFAQGYSLRKDELGVAVFGNCATCGTRIKSCYCF